MMSITDESGYRVGDSTIADYLRQKLEFFRDNSAAGRAFLEPLLANAEYSVVIKTDVPIATSGKRVTVDPTKCHVTNGDAADAAGPKEFVESVVFELKNAENSATFRSLDLQVKTAQISPISYGKQKATTESQSTWNLATILKELRTANVYTPSDFGQKQVDSTAGRDSDNVYALWFRDEPHENGAAGRPGLPSWQFYACAGAQMLGGTPKNLNDVVTLKKTAGNRTTVWNSMANKLPGGNGISSMNDSSIKFYKAVVSVCADPPAGFTATWRSGTADDWKFTEDMNEKTPDAKVWIEKIKQILGNSGQFNDVSKA